MIKNVMSHSLIAALLLGGSGAAYSADLDKILYAPQMPRTQPVEVGSGWYLRGDVGYNFETDGSATSFRVWDFTNDTYLTQPYATTEFDSDLTWGLGVGYQFNNWFRAEALASVMNGSFSATSSSATIPCTGGVPLTTGCDVTGGADFTAWSVMGNGYVDLGTYAGFTPYVGAGVGYTLVQYENYWANELCVDGGGGCPAGNPFQTGHQGEKDWRFTYALMAGIAYEFARNLKVDIGYKYTNVDGGDIYQFDGTSVADGASGIQSSDDGFDTHQILASIRYSLW